jgi:hypothetical protein
LLSQTLRIKLGFTTPGIARFLLFAPQATKPAQIPLPYGSHRYASSTALLIQASQKWKFEQVVEALLEPKYWVIVAFVLAWGIVNAGITNVCGKLNTNLA